MKIETTLGTILSFNPRGLRPGSNKGWDKLTTTLGTTDKDAKVTLLQILDSNGVRDAFWALRCWDYKIYCDLLADVAESVLHIFEERYPNNKRPRQAIDGIRKFKRGEITLEELRKLADAAAYSTSDYSTAAAEAAYTAYYAAAYYAAAYSAVVAGASWTLNEQLMRDWIERNEN